jgi:hypothetical protein
MGKVKVPEPVILFSGIITSESNLSKLREILNPLGEVDFVSETLSFDEFTNYYAEEMGKGLLRAWVLFKGLRPLEGLHKIKLLSNEIEDKFSVSGKRTINIDPGYVTLSNVILFTTKNYSHRIYIGDGIFAEVTLIYSKKEGFIELPWTYPDYKTEVAKDFFKKAREKLKLLRIY